MTQGGAASGRYVCCPLRPEPRTAGAAAHAYGRTRHDCRPDTVVSNISSSAVKALGVRFRNNAACRPGCAVKRRHERCTPWHAQFGFISIAHTYVAWQAWHSDDVVFRFGRFGCDTIMCSHIRSNSPADKGGIQCVRTFDMPSGQGQARRVELSAGFATQAAPAALPHRRRAAAARRAPQPVPSIDCARHRPRSER